MTEAQARGFLVALRLSSYQRHADVTGDPCRKRLVTPFTF